jgi:predicted DNA-binding WGR domain protein
MGCSAAGFFLGKNVLLSPSALGRSGTSLTQDPLKDEPGGGHCGHRSITFLNQWAWIDSSNALDLVARGVETPLMPNKTSAPVHLHRVDATQNMHRFYSLAIQPTLFGGASVIRNWGRIGTRGRAMVATFDTTPDAVDEHARLEKAKRRRGYTEPA